MVIIRFELLVFSVFDTYTLKGVGNVLGSAVVL